MRRGTHKHIRGHADMDGKATIGECAVKGHARLNGDVNVGGCAVLEGDVTISSGFLWDVHWWKDVP